MKKKEWNNRESRNQNFVCKYASKRGWKYCPRQYKVCFLHKVMNIMIYCTPEEHCHEEDENYTTKENYHWTKTQEEIIIKAIKNNVKNSLILRELKEKAAVNGSNKFPTLGQVGVKKRYLKNVKCQENFIVDVHSLRNYCEKKSIVPDNDDEPFIPFHYIEGDTQDNLIMTVIWSTKKLLSRIDKKLIQDDASYKLNWYQYPMFVCGRSCPTGRFFLSHCALSSHEDTSSWVRIQAFVKSQLGENPR